METGIDMRNKGQAESRKVVKGVGEEVIMNKMARYGYVTVARRRSCQYGVATDGRRVTYTITRGKGRKKVQKERFAPGEKL